MSRRVLVVEDDPVNRLVTTAQIQELGYAADSADGGEAALALLARQPYDAVLLDCEMPGLDGYETCRRLRQEGGRRIPVIALTSHTGAAARESCLAAGMDDHLGKPLRSGDLAAVLERWLADGAGLQPPPPTVSETIAEPLEERLEGLARLGEATGEDLLARVVESFLQQGKRNLATLREALARGDGAAFAAAAHALAGSSGILGAAGLAAGCAELEALTRQGDLAACEARLAAVEQTWRQVAGRVHQHSVETTHNKC